MTPNRWNLRGCWTDLVSISFLTALLGALGLFAYLTRSPDAEVFVRLSTLPVVGGSVDQLRTRYRPFSHPEVAGGFVETDQPLNASRGAGESPDFEFVGGGSRFLSEPTEGSPEVFRSGTILYLKQLASQGSWRQVELPDGAVAWVDLEAKRIRQPILGEGLTRPLPLPGREADRELLESALAILQASPAEVRSLRLGEYEVWTDMGSEAESETRLKRWGERVGAAELAYTKRYGRVLLDGPRETMVIFSRWEDYRRFQDQSARLSGLQSTGHADRGLVALSSERIDALEVELTLLHEMGHLLNRRALGPALPPWLEEGLAEDFSESDIPLERFRLNLGSEKGTERGVESYWLLGPLAALDTLRRAQTRGCLFSLSELVALDRDRFVEAPTVRESWRDECAVAVELGSLPGPMAALGSNTRGDAPGVFHYAMSGWFVRYLMEEHRAVFLEYLGSVSRGEPPSAQRLVDLLEIDWPLIDSGYRRFLSRTWLQAKS